MLFYTIHAWHDEIKSLSLRVTTKTAVALMLTAFMAVGLSFLDQMRINSGQVMWTRHLNLPIGTRVFSDQAFNIYPVIYENPNQIQIYPPLETTFANDKTSESVVATIIKTRSIASADCAYFERNGIDYVISTAKVSASCLVEVNKDVTAKVPLKMWKVKNKG
jgi:hypothetical protein